MPVTAELAGDLRDAATLAADPDGDPPAGAIRHHRPRWRDPAVLTCPHPLRAVRVGTPEAVLAPHQTGRSPERRQIHQLDHRQFLHPLSAPARRAAHHRHRNLDMHPQQTLTVLDAEHGHLRETNEERAHARRFHFHRGSPTVRR